MGFQGMPVPACVSRAAAEQRDPHQVIFTSLVVGVQDAVYIKGLKVGSLQRNLQKCYPSPQHCSQTVSTPPPFVLP